MSIKIKAIIFDFDGVIADSLEVKTNAFIELYRPYGKAIYNKVAEHHKANGGMSRDEKFKIYHNEYLGKKINENFIDKLSYQFSQLVVQKVIDSPYVQGAYEFLSSKYNWYEFFISTGTPTEEIKTILKERKIEKYFKEVYGSPAKKTDHIKTIINKYGYKNEEIVFIGDSLIDLVAAEKNKLKFIGRVTTIPEIKKQKYTFNNFNQLNQILSDLQLEP